MSASRPLTRAVRLLTSQRPPRNSFVDRIVVVRFLSILNLVTVFVPMNVGAAGPLQTVTGTVSSTASKAQNTGTTSVSSVMRPTTSSVISMVHQASSSASAPNVRTAGTDAASVGSPAGQAISSAFSVTQPVTARATAAQERLDALATYMVGMGPLRSLPACYDGGRTPHALGDDSGYRPLLSRVGSSVG